MDADLAKKLLESISEALSSSKRQDEVAVPTYNPEKMDNGAEAWCKSVDDLGSELKWSGLQKLAKGGANCSLLKESIASRLGCHLIQQLEVLDGIGSGRLHTFAKTFATISVDDLDFKLDLHVVRDDDCIYDCIIGQNVVHHSDISIVTDINGTKLVRKKIVNTLNVEQVEHDLLSEAISSLDLNLQVQIKKIFQKYPQVLPTVNNYGNVSTNTLKIKLKNDKNINYRPYRLSPLEREKVKTIVNDLLQAGIIRESESSYASPIILVKKQDGSYRMCVDYRALNSIIEKERYPLPLIQDEIDQLGKASYFISIDMKNGFHQIPVDPDSIKYTAFITPDGHFEYLKMPFGICNGPAVFQRAISKAVKHLKFLRVYMDDLLIPCENIDQGLEYLSLTLAALVKAGFIINPKKCQFFKTSIEYLGWNISAEGVRPSDFKVAALVDSPIPKTVKQARQFMGLASYFRKFIPEFASKTAPITKLTKKDQNWEWGGEQIEARNYIIDKLTSKPLLCIFDPLLPTELHTDASSIGYGGILIQKHGTNNKVVGYYSRKTTDPESRYSSYELETLAVFNALKHFRVYLLGIRFKLVTDCNAIKSTQNKKDLSPRVARWWIYMQDYDFEVVYKKGIYVCHVDYLSRNPIEFDSRSTQTKPLDHAKNSNVIPDQSTQKNILDPVKNINVISDQSSWLEKAQQKDPQTLSLIDKVQAGEADSNQYVFRNNLLYYKDPEDSKPKLYVPKGSRLNILRLYHDENCHIGVEKTLKKVQESFWFPKIKPFVTKYISHCLPCVKGKSHSGPHQGFLHPIDKIPIPFHTWHLDCTGPFPQTKDGYKYVLITIDAFTKFCLLHALKSLSGEEMLGTIKSVMAIFGSPSRIISDRATNFSNEMLGRLFKECNVEHHMISTGTPRGNGQVERYVSTIINMLTTTCNSEAEWPSFLSKVQQTLNTTVHKTTSFSPLRLLIGRNANTPCIQALLNDLGEQELSDFNQIIDTTSERITAYDKMKSAAEEWKARFDQKRRDNAKYSMGDLVYVSQEHRRHSKLSPKFKGPYEVMEAIENDRYILKGSGRLQNITVAKDKLRLWPGEWTEENAAAEQDIMTDE